jgi:hypothetical protein
LSLCSALMLRYYGAVNSTDRTLCLLFMAFWIALFGLYHYMIYAVNKHLPTSSRIPHVRISQDGMWGSHGFEWSGVLKEYRRLYPNGFANTAAMLCLVSIVALAVTFVGLRTWEYTHASMP